MRSLYLWLTGLVLAGACRGALPSCPSTNFLQLNAQGELEQLPLPPSFLRTNTPTVYGKLVVDDPACNMIAVRIFSMAAVNLSPAAGFNRDAATSAPGYWSTDTFGPLVDDDYFISVTISGEGRQSQSAGYQFRIGATPCAFAMTNPKAGDAFPNPSFSITGTSSNKCRNIQLYGSKVGDSAQFFRLETMSDWATGSWSVAFPATLPAGQYTITGTANPSDGSYRPSASSSPVTFTIQANDRPTCSGVTLTTPRPGGSVLPPVYSFTGTSVAGDVCDVLDVYVNGVLDKSGIEANRGDGSVFFNLNTPLSTPGTYTIRLVERQSAGLAINAAQQFSLTVKSPCGAPSVTRPSSSSVTAAVGETVTFEGSVPNTACPYVIVSLPDLQKKVAVQIAGSGFSAAVNGLVAGGPYRVLIGSAADAQGTNLGDTVEYSLLVITPCAKPIITSPTAEANVANTFTITGTQSTPECSTAMLYVGGNYKGTANLQSDGTFRFETTVANPGRYSIAVVSQGNGRRPAGTDGNLYVNIQGSAVTQVCSQPVLISPQSNIAVNGGRITLTGSATTTADCSRIGVFVNGIASGSVSFVAATRFTASVPATQDGDHIVWVQALPAPVSSSWGASVVTDADKRSIRAYQTPCSAPQLTSPVAGQSYSGQIPFAGTVDGRPECGTIEVYVNGNRVYTAPVAPASRRKRAVTIDFKLSTAGFSGDVDITVVNTGLNNGVSTPAVRVTVLNNAIGTGGLGRRKRQQCNAGRTMCPYEMSRGRMGYECIDDVMTNIERCGSCDGPDCTMIDNASSVACVKAKCIVAECATGYTLVANTCIAELEFDETSIESVIGSSMGLMEHLPW